MAGDDKLDVMQQAWESSVPVQLRLAESEVTTVEQPPVLYFLVPRHSYLLSLLPKALPFLQHVLPPGEDTPWVEHDSLPLKWNVPAGVLYDLVAGERELPWSLTLHFRGYPSSVLPAFEGEAALRGSLLNSLKEAAFVCRGSSLRVMEMAPGAQESLYRSVLQGDLPLYRSILGSLQLAPAPRGGRGPAVPLRVFVRAGGRGYLSSYEGIAFTSRPVECQRPGGGLVTLREALLPLLDEYLAAPGEPAAPAVAAKPAAALAEGGGNGGAAAAQQPAERGSVAGEGAFEVPEAAGEEANSAGGDVESSDAPESAVGGQGSQQQEQQQPAAAAAGAAVQERLRQVLVCGTSPPLDTPLAWLHTNMHAADLFLYVVVHVSQ